MSWTNLEGKVVIVTGGAAGIGLAVTQGFVEVGAKVMIADFAEDAGQKAAEEVSQKGFGEAALPVVMYLAKRMWMPWLPRRLKSGALWMLS